jgi:hypothetical protein
MLLLTALAGFLTASLIATVAMAYRLLPSGRMCTCCGGPTDPVETRFPLRLGKRWVHWRWCSRCGWEGVGRNGPDVGWFDLPVDHDSGFRWRRPDGTDVPIFIWKPEGTDPDTNDAEGFRWARSDGEPPEARSSLDPRFRRGRLPLGFRWKDD